MTLQDYDMCMVRLHKGTMQGGLMSSVALSDIYPFIRMLLM